MQIDLVEHLLVKELSEPDVYKYYSNKLYSEVIAVLSLPAEQLAELQAARGNGLQ